MLESIFVPFFTVWHTIKYMNVGENFLEKSYFLEENPICVLFFWVGVSYFPIFLTCPIT